MLYFSFLCFILFSCSQAENIFDKFLNGSIDWKVNPCDNFYRHACRKDIKQSIDEVYKKPVREMFENSEYRSKTDDASRLQKVLETTAENLMTISTSEAIQEFGNLCVNSSTQATKYIVKLGKTLKPISRTATKCLLSIDKNTDCPRCYLESIESLQLDGQSSAVQRLNDTLEDVRKNSIGLIDETPWIKNANKVRVFEKLANSVKFPNLFQKILDDKETNFQKSAEQFSECVLNSNINQAMKNIVCLFNLNRVIGNYVDRNRIVVLRGNDGGNTDGVLYFGESFYHAAKHLNKAQYMAFVGASLIGHEFGHSIILDDIDLSEDENLIFSNKTRQCVDKSFSDSCKLFKEGDCTLQATQFDDNGADLIGFQIAFDIFKTQFATSENIEEKEKEFFYAFAAGWCELFPTEGGDGQHQPSNIRVNAVVSQIPEFREIFECGADSPMVASNKQQCTLFGRNAPETKHRERLGKF